MVSLVEAKTLDNHTRAWLRTVRDIVPRYAAVTALLQKEGFSSHKHSGVISLFDRHWIKPGRLPVTMGRFYRKLFELRHHGDYASMLSLDDIQLSDLLDEARRFIERIEQVARQDSNGASQEASH